MMGHRAGSALAAAVAITIAACAAGCAVGVGPDGYIVGEDSGSGERQQGSDGGGSNDAGGRTPLEDAGNPTGDAGEGDGGDAESDAGSDAGGIACTSPNTCASATVLGKMSGDTSGPDLSSKGDTAEWLVADVTENDNSPLGVPMKLTVTLTSPPGMNFDLYVYLGADVNAIECTTVKASSTLGVGQTDSVNFEWGELGPLANGVDDSRHVSVEVRYVSGTCQANDQWSLTLHGH
jgi:hypothetical protein